MSDIDRDKWNQRYAENSYRKGNPVTLLEDWLSQIPPGKALDVACGAGRNSILLAQNGFAVDAIDISSEGLKLGRQQADAMGLAINWIEHDLDNHYDFDLDYQLILVLWYVDLKLINRLGNCLAPGGYLICEEHLQTDLEVVGPGNREFRVAPGELRKAADSLEILLEEEALRENSLGEAMASARIVARRASGFTA